MYVNHRYILTQVRGKKKKFRRWFSYQGKLSEIQARKGEVKFCISKKKKLYEKGNWGVKDSEIPLPLLPPIISFSRR